MYKSLIVNVHDLHLPFVVSIDFWQYKVEVEVGTYHEKSTITNDRLTEFVNECAIVIVVVVVAVVAVVVAVFVVVVVVFVIFYRQTFNILRIGSAFLQVNKVFLKIPEFDIIARSSCYC